MSSVSDYGSRRLMIRCASRPNDSTTQPVYMVGLYFNCSMDEKMKILYFFYITKPVLWVLIGFLQDQLCCKYILLKIIEGPRLLNDGVIRSNI